MSPKNVVLICADQWRGDCLSAAGHPVLKTPYLDALAASGVRMSNAYSATPTCVPARMALISGLAAKNHRRVGYQDGVAFDVEQTLPGEFSRSGYQTQAIGKMHYWPERVRAGFDNVILHDGFLHHSRRGRRDVAFYDDYLVWLREQAGESAVADYFDDGIDCNSVVARPWSRPEALHPTNWVVAEAEKWLYRRDVTQPFFLYLSFHRPHPPYNPPAWAFEQYLGCDDYEPPVGDWADDFAEHREDGRPDALVADYDQATRNRARAGYYGNMTHVDHQINRFLEMLTEFDLRDDTVVCFTSDHGEMLGDHNLWRKGFPYEGSARVPLIVAGPGIPQNQVYEPVVELRDIMPTLLDAAGLPAPQAIDGRSLLPDARNAATDGTPGEGLRAYLHGEHQLLGQSLQWIRLGPWKYVWLSGSGTEQLFDLDADPEERVNRVDDTAAQPGLTACRTALISELTGREEGYVAHGELVAGRSPVAVLTRDEMPQPAAPQ